MARWINFLDVFLAIGVFFIKVIKDYWMFCFMKKWRLQPKKFLPKDGVVQKHLCKKLQQTNISFELISSTHWMECNLKMCHFFFSMKAKIKVWMKKWPNGWRAMIFWTDKKCQSKGQLIIMRHWRSHCASFVVLSILALFCCLQVVNFILFSSWLWQHFLWQFGWVERNSALLGQCGYVCVRRSTHSCGSSQGNLCVA